jgi:aminodeoxyfutalosine deaminase
MDGSPIEDGAVTIAGDRIVAVGRFRELREGGTIIDLGEVVLLPGLINAHCHLDFTLLRGKIEPQPSFADWIRQINTSRRELTEEDYLDSIMTGFEDAQRWGTTTIASIESFPSLLERMAPPALRTWWFAELIDIRAALSADEVVARTLAHFAGKENWRGGFGLSPHAPYTASRQLTLRAAETGLPIQMHVAESHEEMEMFRHGRGALFDFLQSLGRPMNDCGQGKTPLALMLDRGVLDERWIVVHLNELSEDDFARLERAPRFQIVHCPRSSRYFGHREFALRRLCDLGFNIALGTDSLASNSSLSLFAEMRSVRDSHPWLGPEQVVEMATVNGARALGQSQRLGKIRPGFQADFIALPIANPLRDLFEKIIAWSEPVPWMMLAGIRLAPDSRDAFSQS